MTFNHKNWIEQNRDFLIEQSKMLQAIIARMASQSVEIKKYSITIWSALVGLGFSTKEPSLFALSSVPVIFLGLLDVYYLHLERRFRVNFNRLAEILGDFELEIEDNLGKFPRNFVALDPLSPRQIVEAYKKSTMVVGKSALSYNSGDISLALEDEVITKIYILVYLE